MSYQLKPISSDRDHATALAEFERLFDAPEGSADAYRRDVLAILIEKYEKETVSIPLPDPIAAIKFRLEQAGLSRKVLEPILGGRAKVSEILSGKRELTLAMARGLHAQLGIPAESLLGAPSAPDDAWADIDFGRFPIAEMAKNGAFRTLGIAATKENAETAIRKLVDALGGPAAIPAGCFRKSDSSRLNAKLNSYALNGWCLQVLAEAGQVEAPPFRPGAADAAFLRELVQLSAAKPGPKLAQESLRRIGIVLVIVPHLKNTYLDGAAFLTPAGRPVIGLTLRYDKLDNFWFALLHELGHLVLHLSGNPGAFLVDDLSLRGARTDSALETAADRFAEDALLPEDFDLDRREFVSTFDVLSYAQELGISPAIVAGRIQHTKQNYRLFANLIGRGEVKAAFG
jgi:HTH-type transcriptional regulator/antitoxin HigA